MSCSYVCASCRRYLVRRARRIQKIQWQQKTSYISLSPLQPSQDIVDKKYGGRGSKENDTGRSTAVPRSIPPVEHLKSVEEDFLERILKDRDPHRSSPYSKRRTTKPKPPHEEKYNGYTFTKFAVESRPSSLNVFQRAVPKEPLINLSPEVSSSDPPPDQSLRPSADSPLQGYLSSSAWRRQLGIPDSAESNQKTEHALEQLTPLTLSPEAPISSGSHTQPITAPSGPPPRIYPSSSTWVQQLRKRDHARFLGEPKHAPEQSNPRLRTPPAHQVSYSEPKRPTQPVNLDYPLQRWADKDNTRLETFFSTSTRAVDEVSKAPLPVSFADPISVVDAQSYRLDEIMIDRMLDSKKPSAESWTIFLEHSATNEIFGRTFSFHVRRQLVQKFMHSWLQGDVSDDQPRPSVVLEKCRQSMKYREPLWRETLWSILALAIRRSLTTSSTLPGPPLDDLLHEIMALWAQFRRRYGACRIIQEEKLVYVMDVRDWSTLIQSEQMKAIREGVEKDFTRRFYRFFSRLKRLDFPNADLAALVTFAILRMRIRSANEQYSASVEHHPFQEFMARLLPYSNIASKLANYGQILTPHCLSSTDATTVTEELKLISTNPFLVFAEEQACLSPRSDITTTETPHLLTDIFNKRIGRALEDRNVTRAESLWLEAQRSFAGSEGKNGGVAMPPILYSQFVLTFMALRRPNFAIEVWNTMVKVGIEPNISMWDAMLRGSAIAKDPQALEDMWEKMISSGVRPDAQAWATRIHGLTRSGYWESGIRAFQKMTEDWYHAARSVHGESIDPTTLGDIGPTPKPNTQTLNSLIIGLARGRKHEQLAQAFQWARSLGIQTDAYTFNPLFKIALKQGNAAVATKLLQQMQALGIKPDIATFTMILDSLFREDTPLDQPLDQITNQVVGQTGRLEPRKTHQPSDQQQSAAARIFEEMKRCNIQANAWTFATLINGLLKADGNIVAAYAVTNYMAVNNIPLSSQIYTTLITYHFAETPPDLDAVESLWSRARTDRTVFLDLVFFDRLIEGFARSGEVGRMMTALQQAAKRGKSPGWPAMTEIVRALFNVGDVARIEEVISSIRSEERERDDVRQRTGRDTFWELIGQIGMDGHGRVISEGLG